MITGTFYGNNVRVDTCIDNDVLYRVMVKECDGRWTTVALFSEQNDPWCRDEAITLAKRLQAKVEAL